MLNDDNDAAAEPTPTVSLGPTDATVREHSSVTITTGDQDTNAHVCMSPPPSYEGEEWTCPECGREYEARQELRFRPKMPPAPGDTYTRMEDTDA